MAGIDLRPRSSTPMTTRQQRFASSLRSPLYTPSAQTYTRLSGRVPPLPRGRPGADGTPGFTGLPRMPGAFALSPVNAHDAPQGRRLLKRLGRSSHRPAPVMDRACEDDETYRLAADLGFTPVVPPKRNRVSPREYDRERYRRRNGVERLFRRLKGFRRVFPRFDRPDVMFPGFIVFVLVVDALCSVNPP